MTASNWPQVRLKEVGKWFSGGTPSKSNPGYWTDGNVPWLSPKDMGPEILAGTQDHITEEAVEKSKVKRVPAGSVALVVRSGILERTLPVAVVPFETTLNQDMKAVVARPGVDARWIAWGLRASEYEMLRKCRKTGTTVASIEMPRLYEHTIPVPLLADQRRIVDILEDHLSRIDAASRSLSAAHRRSEQLRAVILEFLAPKGTPLRTLGQLAIDSRYGTSTKCVVNGPGVPVVRIPNLRGGRIDLVDEKRVAEVTVNLTRLMLDPDDLLIVRTNGSRDLIGRAAIVQSGVSASFASYLIRFRLDPSQVRPQWTRIMLGTPSVRRVLEAMAASSAGQYNLGLKKLNCVTIPCPPIEDQDRLLARFDEQEWALASLTRSLAEGKMKAQSLRRSLLAAAFSGRLTGSSTDMEMVEEMAGV